MNILAVDDDPVNLKLLKTVLQPQGYSVITADNGADAVKKVMEGGMDLVLLDIMMPGMDGYETVKQIKNINKVPVIMLTALSEKDDLLKAMESGADEFLSKPFFKAELLVRVKNMLKLKEYQNNLEIMVADRTKKLGIALEDLQKLHLEMLNRLLTAAEYRDDATGKHIIRVGKCSAMICSRMGLDSEESELITLAAPMHDIGKIGIPDLVLLKPGKLNTEEFAIMKKHTTIGSRILHGSAFRLVQCAEQIAATHHEKWDGSGYPAGLKGPDIPLAGRITAVADVFDALMSKRPYKKAFDFDSSINEIKAGIGAHFDEKTAGAFMDARVEIRELYRQFGEETGPIPS